MDPDRWTEHLAGLHARQAEAAREGRIAEAEGRPVIYIHGRPYADPGAEPPPKATARRKRPHRDPEEGAAAAGAAAEAAGQPISWNPHKRPGPLRQAWADGWRLSYADRHPASDPETARRGP